jgi:hypothetical protein
LLGLIDGFVAAECEQLKIRRTDYRFSRRQLREAIHWGDTQLKIHLARLSELEYLVAHRTKTGGFEYELVYALQEVPSGGDTADADTLRFPGLIDIEALQCAYDAARSGQDEPQSAPGRGAVGPRSAGGRGEESAADAQSERVSGDLPGASDDTHCSQPNPKTSSYPQPVPLAAAGV